MMGPRHYLVGQALPFALNWFGDKGGRDRLEQSVRLAIYIADLTQKRMGEQVTHDFEFPDSVTMETPKP